MYYRDSLVIYDLEGNIIRIDATMQSESELPPIRFPKGIPYITIPFKDANFDARRLIKIDTTKPPHHPI